MTTIQDALTSGFDALLEVGGQKLTASTGDVLLCLVEEAPELADPTDNLQSKTPVYARVACKAGAIDSPRTVQTFTDEAGKVYTVLRYEENVFGIKEQWITEKQRA